MDFPGLSAIYMDASTDLMTLKHTQRTIYSKTLMSGGPITTDMPFAQKGCCGVLFLSQILKPPEALLTEFLHPALGAGSTGGGRC